MVRVFPRRVFNAFQERVSSHETRSRINSLIALSLPSRLPLIDAAAPLYAQLSRTGFAMLPATIQEDELRCFRDELEREPCMDPWRPHLAPFGLNAVPPTTNNAHVMHVRNKARAVAIANNPLILSVVSSYLGCKPTIDDVLAWWSVPGRHASVQEQNFHRDRDSIRFVKLFVYLSDVRDCDGPHVFVRGSHRSKRLLAVRRRYTDDEVLQEFGESSVCRFTGPFGTAFLEDTFGLHKGDLPRGERPRLIFQVRYTSVPSNFARTSSAPVPADLDAYMNRYVF